MALSKSQREALILLLSMWEPRNGWQRILKSLVLAALTKPDA